MSEVKPVSFRINEEDQEKFKKFASENNFNQAEAFNSIIGMLELEKARNSLGNRANSIDSFRDTVNKLVNFYVNALEENSTTDERIREEFAKELSTKDNTITNLYEQLQEVKDNNNHLEENCTTVQNNNELLMESCRNLKENIQNLQNQLDIANRNNSNLQDQVAEYKEYKNLNIELEKEINQLKSDKIKSDNEISGLKNNVDKINGELLNANKMINFYTKEIESKDKSIDEYKEDAKTLKSKHEKEINSLKVDYHDRMGRKSQEVTEALTSKFELELGKKDLEIEKLKNEIDQLKTKSTKTAKKVQDKE